MKLSILFAEFIQRRKDEEGIMPSTVKHYNYMVLDLFIKRFLRDPEVTDITIQDYRKYVAHLRSRDLETKSIHTYYTHVKSFANYLYKEHYSEVDIIRDGPRIKVYQKITEIYYDDDIEMIFYELTSRENSLEKMVIKLCFALLLDTGMRPSELCRIKLEDINLINRTILLHGEKVYMDRIVPISPPVARYLTQYLKRRIKPVNEVDKDVLIISRRTMRAINSKCIANYVKRYIKEKCHITRGTAYLFRHSYATRKLFLGTPIYDIKLVMGHTRVSTTEKYLRNASQLSMSQNVNISDTTRLLNRVLFT